MPYDKIKIKTNNHWNNFLYGYELPEKIKPEFDYIDSEEFDCHNFLKYKGNYYDLGEFMNNGNLPDFHPFRSWDGHHSYSFSAGILIRVSNDCEQYQIATFIA